MRSFFSSALLFATLVIYAASATAADAGGAKLFVDAVATEVLAIVKNGDASKAEKEQKIEAIFKDKVDLNFVAKFVLGKHWRTASAAQQQSYLMAYKPFIMKNYANKLTKYSGQTYTLKTPRDEGDAAVVTMDIIDPNGQNVSVDYRLRGAEKSGYKIIDITVEGVSLLATQRSEFDSIVQNKGIDGLIDALKKQVAEKA